MKISPQDAVRALIEFAGDSPDRAGLIDTPERVVRSYAEIFSGYTQDAGEILSRQFSMDDDTPLDAYSGMVLLGGIEFYSTCEHHMLPFFGSASVGYVPGPSGKVVGISKLARVVDVFARRLQCQERITTQVADAVHEHLDASGTIVVIRAAHHCMRCRGVGKQNSTMITSEVRGVFSTDAAARAEALSLFKDSR